MLNSEYAKQRILDAASVLFGQTGFAATTMRMIAKEADVSLSAIPYYFESKENLFSHVVARATKQFTAYFSDITDEIQAYLDAPVHEKARARELVVRICDKHIDYVFDPQNDVLLRLFFQVRSTQAAQYASGEPLRLTTVQPTAALLRILKPELSEQDALLLAYSLVGEQLFFFYHRPSILAQLSLPAYDASTVARIRTLLLNKLDLLLN